MKRRVIRKEEGLYLAQFKWCLIPYWFTYMSFYEEDLALKAIYPYLGIKQ